MISLPETYKAMPGTKTVRRHGETLYIVRSPARGNKEYYLESTGFRWLTGRESAKHWLRGGLYEVFT